MDNLSVKPNPNNKAEHTWYKCPQPCSSPGSCPYCDGGLGYCTVCGGAEGTLSSECCGYNLDDYVLAAIYHGGLDYVRDKWVVAYCRHGNPATNSGAFGKVCKICLDESIEAEEIKL